MELLKKIDISTEKLLADFARDFSKQLHPGKWVALQGELGAGKTSFVRHLMRAFNYHDPVVSPSYPLMIEYKIGGRQIIHIDGFRLEGNHQEPWDWNDWHEALLFVEWPEKLSRKMSDYDYRLLFNFDSENQKREILVFHSEVARLKKVEK